MKDDNRITASNILVGGIMEIAICIATFKRPKLLAELLRELSGLIFNKIDEPLIKVIVVDNDASGSAESICRESMTRWPLIYRIESRRGIAQARNRALKEIGLARYVAFIDDDETPDPEWLQELIVAMEVYKADVTSGPVLPSFAPGVPEWTKGGNFFNSPNYRSGKRLNDCATNNTLVARSVFDTVTQFDERFQLAGGDDLHFFMRVNLSGLKIVWTNEAIVHEKIGHDRANFRWLLRRAYRGGNCYALAESALDQRLSTRVIRVCKATLRIAQGCLASTGALFMGKVYLVRSLRQMCAGMGMLTGLFNLTYQAYSTITGE